MSTHMDHPSADLYPPELRQARELIAKGRSAEAVAILVEFVRRYPDSEDGWVALGLAVNGKQKQIYCFQRVLQINPANAQAVKALEKLGAAAAPRQPSISTPMEAERGEGAASSGQVSDGQGALNGISPTGRPLAARPRTRRPKPGKLAAGAASSMTRKTGTTRPGLVSGVLIGILAVLGGLLVVLVGGWFLQSQGESRRLVYLTQTARALPTQTPLPSHTPTPVPPTATRTPTLPPSLTPTATFIVPSGDLRMQMDDIAANLTDLRFLQPGSSPAIDPRLLDVRQLDQALENELERLVTTEELDQLDYVYETLGLIQPFDAVSDLLLDELGESRVGAYFPAAAADARLYLAFDNDDSVSEMTVRDKLLYAHLAAHAFLDQSYGYTARQPGYPFCRLPGMDHCQAFSALVEGDATALVFDWLDSFASSHDIAALEGDFPGAQLPEDLPQVMAAMNRRFAANRIVLPYETRLLRFRYQDGLGFVSALLDEGGPERVEAAYQDASLTSESIIHPDKYLLNEFVKPVSAPNLARVLGPDWRPVISDTLGELMTEMILGYSANALAQVDAEMARAAAEGWGADQFQIYDRSKTNDTVLAVHWVWDYEVDRDLFWQAMQQYHWLRYPAPSVDTPAKICWVSVNNPLSCIFRSQLNVLWLRAPDMALIDQLAGSYPEFIP